LTHDRPLRLLLILSLLCSLSAPVFAADPPSSSTKPDSAVKIKPKTSKASSSSEGGESSGGLLQPDINNIDAPTSAVLDYGGYSSMSRFYSRGGILEYVDFGIFQGLNLGGSLAMDGIVGNERNVRLRAPNVQVKYRFYDGDRWLPSAAVGYDGQGYDYNSVEKRYNNRQRGFYVVATQETGLPGLEVHPSLNVSDFDTNAIFGSIPVSYNIRDKVSLMLEWDNINNFNDSRLNAGVRVYMTQHFHLDFGVRRIGQGGVYPNGDNRGSERIVQIRYTGNF
jgi:hypothetical protein